jgi:hypothetical protein
MKQLPKKYFVAIGAYLVVVAVIGVVIQSHRSPKKTINNPQPQAEVITNSTDTPDEQKPDKATYQWHGGPNDPKYIDLPTITGGGFLQNVGVDQHQEIAVPNNVYLAGWFIKSVRPGEKGLSIIDGHVVGRVNNGIFGTLHSLKVGDTFSVAFGDTTNKSFTVKKMISVAVTGAPGVLFSQDPNITNQLNLITCTGKYDATTHLYDQRLIVIASANQ